MEPIAGATTPVEFAAVDQPVISADAIAEAERFAKANNSTALVVLYDGKLAHEVYWDGYSRDTEFSSHSMVKTLTGLAVATAQADGFIDSFDDPVSKYLPEAAGRPFADRTIRQLLHMASGVETVPLSRDPGSKIVQLSYGSDILSTALSFDMAAAPDTNFNHDNSHSILLGAIVSAATGQRYADYVSARIWNPIGARTAKLFLDRPGDTPHTDCCMASHPMDWIKVGEFLRNKGRVGGEQVVPETAIEAMLEPSPGNPNYGFQIWLGTPYTENRSYRGDLRGSYHSEPYLADDLFFLDGFGGKRVYVIPSRKLVIMRLGTSSDTWDDAVLPNTIMRGLIADSGSN